MSDFVLLKNHAITDNPALIPDVVYKNMSEAVKKHPEADVLINFASLRSAFDATMEAMTFNQVRREGGKRREGKRERERERGDQRILMYCC